MPIIDLTKQEAKTHSSVFCRGAEVEQVNSFRFLEMSDTENLTVDHHPDMKKRLYFLRKLKIFSCQF